MERTTEPKEIVKGERIAWTKTLDGYPASEWTLEYRFRGRGAGVNVTATSSGDVFEAAITAAQTATMSPSPYEWQAWLTEKADAANTFVASTGTVRVKTGFSAASTAAVDNRSQAEITLEALNAAIASRATSDQLEYEVSTPAGSRRIKRMPLTELLEARKIYSGIVARERQAARIRQGGRFGIRVVGRLNES